ncbi:MAG: TRL domain-containing protein [Desulfosudaceae bacterium]
MKWRIWGLVLLMGLLGPGCLVTGFLYTNTTRPLTVNMAATPRGEVSGRAGSKHIQEPVTGLGLSANWDGRAIGQAAARAGLETVYLADLHSISILGGLWRQQTIHVWGKDQATSPGD